MKIPIQVSTGRLSRRVMAETPVEAVKTFLQKYKPTQLGYLASCRSKYLDDTYYVSMSNVLDELGLTYKTLRKP
jgi:hypothetical protein